MVEKEKKNFGFGINNCPLWLFKTLDKEAKERYNDQYWVVLLTWYQKAKAYDLLSVPEDVTEEYVSENPEKKIKLMG